MTVITTPQKVSLIIPVYNVDPPLMWKCFESVKRQTFRIDDFEVVVVDDASTDQNSIDAINQFCSEQDNATLIRLTNNQGLNHAREEGVSAASGDYIIFLDSDDMIATNALEKLYEIAHNENADIVIGGIVRRNPENESILKGRAFFNELSNSYLGRLRSFCRFEYSMSMCGKLVRRNLIDRHTFDMPNKIFHEDITTTFRLLFKAKSVIKISSPMYYYTMNPRSITSEISEKHIKDVFWNLHELVRLAISEKQIENVYRDIPVGVDRLLYTSICRVIGSEKYRDDKKIALLRDIGERRAAFPLMDAHVAENKMKVFLELLDSHQLSAEQKLKQLHDIFQVEKVVIKESVSWPIGIHPSRQSVRLKGKIVFVCDVDYQLLNAARVAKVLKTMGHKCTILDNSKFVLGGKRQLSQEEYSIFSNSDCIKMSSNSYNENTLSTALLVITFNDWSKHLEQALEYRNMLGLPSIGFVEGISDFLRSDSTSMRAITYRRTKYVFLAGKHDERFFPDRCSRVVGMPNLEPQYAKNAVFPKEALAVLNLNFTYGMLEWKRHEFLQTAIDGLNQAGIEYTISQHPADSSSHHDLPVSKLSQYELIDKGSVFISRFATGILEALAAGKPVIYFNPHGEQALKFQEPLGAYRIALNAEELSAAIYETLKDIENGVDFRSNAQQFLELHAGKDSTKSASEIAAENILEIVNSEEDYNRRTLAPYLKSVQPTFTGQKPEGLVGVFDRDRHAILNEEELVSFYFGNSVGFMIDVGANMGKVSDLFLAKQWNVHAFEPDPENRRRLESRLGGDKRLTINQEAVSNESGLELPLFASEDSTGISSLSAFTKGHEQICTVSTITLDDYCARLDIGSIDFLKIDVGGHDKFVLEGFPWDRIRPRVIQAEFENNKTVPLGYTVHDLASLLLSHGYSVYISEWHPIIKYGAAHDWCRILPYSTNLDLELTWGNVLAFKETPDFDYLQTLALKALAYNRKAYAPPQLTFSRGAAKLKKFLRRALRVLFSIFSKVIIRVSKNPRGARLKKKLERRYIDEIGCS